MSVIEIEQYLERLDTETIRAFNPMIFYENATNLETAKNNILDARKLKSQLLPDLIPNVYEVIKQSLKIGIGNKINMLAFEYDIPYYEPEINIESITDHKILEYYVNQYSISGVNGYNTEFKKINLRFHTMETYDCFKDGIFNILDARFISTITQSEFSELRKFYQHEMEIKLKEELYPKYISNMKQAIDLIQMYQLRVRPLFANNYCWIIAKLSDESDFWNTSSMKYFNNFKQNIQDIDVTLNSDKEELIEIFKLIYTNV
jgi:hypothetical protein